MTTKRPAGLPREINLLRIVAQGLVPATAAGSATEVVRRHGAMQAQQSHSFLQAALLRLSPEHGAPTGALVRDAFKNRELVRSWPMRGTLHVTTAVDHHWMREALLRGDSWLRRMEQNGIDDAVATHAMQVAAPLLADGKAVDRRQLWQAWEEAGVLSGCSAQQPASAYRRALLFRLHREGYLAMGPMRGRSEHAYIDARLLPDATTGPAGASGAKRGQSGRRVALAEIARRYATSHGPVTVADLARWTTLGVREAEQALQDAIELTNAADYVAVPERAQVPLVRARVADQRGSLEILSAPAARAETLYLRADLPDLLDDSRKAATGTLFLPSFDELHVGYKDRSCLADAAGERLICPAQNGMFRPLIVDRGRLVGVYPAGEGLLWLGNKSPAKRLQTSAARVIQKLELIADN